jgi:repressor LexA
MNPKQSVLTAKQESIYNYIKNFVNRHGESPTMIQLQEALGFKSIRSVTQLLETLERKGFIHRESYQKRNIRLIHQNTGPSKQWMQIIPVVTSAGCDDASVFAQEEYNNYMSVDSALLEGTRNPVAIKAVGNSMNDAGIENGDYVLVDATENVSSGDRIAAIVGDMAVIKRLQVSENAIILSPESKDPGYHPMLVKPENFKPIGRVIDVIPMNGPMDDVQFVPFNE